MQSIGKFSLRNQGGFAAKLQCVYWDENGTKVHCDGTGSFPVAQCESLDPGQASPPVPDGSPVSIYAFVVWGNDNTGSQLFTYQSGNATTANYVITGTTLDNQLGVTSMGANTCT
jgi:hypothetical protein